VGRSIRSEVDATSLARAPSPEGAQSFDFTQYIRRGIGCCSIASSGLESGRRVALPRPAAPPSHCLRGDPAKNPRTCAVKSTQRRRSPWLVSSPTLKPPTSPQAGGRPLCAPLAQELRPNRRRRERTRGRGHHRARRDEREGREGTVEGPLRCPAGPGLGLGARPGARGEDPRLV
jgi:hypothetical protein